MNFNIDRSGRGFTLVEMMVVLAVSSLVMAGMISVFLSQHDSYKVQIKISCLQQNLRTGMKMLMDDIRMAGFYTGLDHHTYTNYVNWNPLHPGPDAFRPVIHGVNNINGVSGYREGTDIIMVVKAGKDKGVLASGEGAQIGVNVLKMNNADLNGDSNTDLNTGGSRFGVVAKSDLSAARLFKITYPAKDNPGYITADTFDRSYSRGDLIARADIIIYKIDDTNKNFRSSVLSRKNAGNGNSFQVVAENITDLQFSYILDDGIEVENPMAHEDRIRCVRIRLTGETPAPGDGLKKRTLESMVRIRNIN